MGQELWAPQHPGRLGNQAKGIGPMGRWGHAGLRMEAACEVQGMFRAQSTGGMYVNQHSWKLNRKDGAQGSDRKAPHHKTLNSTLKTTGQQPPSRKGISESSAMQETGGQQCLSGHDSTLRSAAALKNLATNNKATTPADFRPLAHGSLPGEVVHFLFCPHSDDLTWI